MSINVSVCHRCIAKREDGLSRASEAMWDACLAYVSKNNTGLVENNDGFISVFDRENKDKLLMSNENGFDIEDSLLKTVIVQQFSSRRIKK